MSAPAAGAAAQRLDLGGVHRIERQFEKDEEARKAKSQRKQGEWDVREKEILEKKKLAQNRLDAAVGLARAGALAEVEAVKQEEEIFYLARRQEKNALAEEEKNAKRKYEADLIKQRAQNLSLIHI